jgi:TorA maturation chaperone TorD
MTQADLKLQRSDCFKLLAACFYEPDKELFLEEQLCENLISLLQACCIKDAATAAKKMQQMLQETGSDAMKIEHARLFVGPFELVAPPYGSVYLEKTRRLMGDSTIAVQKMYKETGLVLEVKEAPDHIALELEFLHYLGLREAAACEEGLDEACWYAEKQNEFLKMFVAPWVPHLCEKIRQGTDNGFYLSLADCLESFIAHTVSLHETTVPLQKTEESHACRTPA